MFRFNFYMGPAVRLGSVRQQQVNRSRRLAGVDLHRRTDDRASATITAVDGDDKTMVGANGDARVGFDSEAAGVIASSIGGTAAGLNENAVAKFAGRDDRW